MRRLENLVTKSLYPLKIFFLQNNFDAETHGKVLSKLRNFKKQTTCSLWEYQSQFFMVLEVAVRKVKVLLFKNTVDLKQFYLF